MLVSVQNIFFSCISCVQGAVGRCLCAKLPFQEYRDTGSWPLLGEIYTVIMYGKALLHFSKSNRRREANVTFFRFLRADE